MNKKLLFCILLIISFLQVSKTAKATHIMGGSLNYVYLGLDSTTGNYNYQVTIYLYRLCDAGSSLLPIDMNLGVYEDDTLNPNGDKLLVVNTVIPLILQQGITPPNGNDSCTFAPNVCVEEGVYQGNVSLPPNSLGYYFISDRCCRNNNIVNLDNPGNDGEAYFAHAPAPTIVNSSPTFAVAPVPFICNTDTASVLNQAFDPDNDSLVYSFAVPYNGISTGGNPNPNPPVVYPFPIPPVAYAFGYSSAFPFGVGGYASLNSSTGLGQYYSPNQGFYVIAVEISEYRNGVLIGVSRRDIQIIVIPCPVNPAPVLSSTTSQTTYTIEEGDTLCFGMTFNDPNGDSIYIAHNGNIFDSLIVNPPAVFTDSSGAGAASGQFCWETSCDQGNSVPYQFTVFATDNGCPAKITNIVYTINVQNTPAPTVIIGPDTLCATAGFGLIYSTPQVGNYTYIWSIDNGSIVGSNTSDSVVVNFNGTGTSVLSVVAVNHNGCESDSTSQKVVLTSVSVANAGPDVSLCSGDTITIGSPTTAGYTYSWTPSTGLSSTTISDPTVTLPNAGSTPITQTYILTTSLNGCTDVDTVVVTVNPRPSASAGPDVVVCSGDSIGIGSPTVAGNVYLWSPTTGLTDSTISNPYVLISDTTGLPDTFQYIVTVQNSFGCNAVDTVNVTVNVTPIAQAGNDTSVCGGSPVTIGGPSVTGYTYSWSPPTDLSSTTISNPVLTHINTSATDDTLTYIVTVSAGTCSDQDTIQIIIRPSPVSDAGPDQLVCGSGTIQLGTATTAGYIYAWDPLTGLNDSTISDPILTYSNTGSNPDTLIFIVTTTLNGCTTSDSVMVINSPAPTAVAGPDTAFCSGSSVVIGSGALANYVYTWTPSTGLSSSTISDPTVTLTNTSGVNDTVYYVLTVDLFGCQSSDSIMIVVKPNPVANAGPDQFICGSGTVQLGTATTAGYTYSWTPATGLSNSTISDPILTVSNTGSLPDTLIFTVTTTLNGCTTTDVVQVINGPAPTAVAGPDTSFCSGSSVVIGSVTVANYVYTWTPSTGLSSSTISDPTVTLTNTSGVNDTVYYVVSVDLFGCSSSDTIMIVVRPNPVANAGPDQFICGSGTVQLGTATTAGYTYSWTPATGLSNSTISDPILTVSNTGSLPDTLVFTVTTTLNGCTTTDVVQVINGPAPTAVAGPDTAFCSGSSVMIGSGAVANYVYTWTPSTGLSSSTVSNPTVTLTNTSGVNDTVYYVLSVDLFGCQSSDTIMIVVRPNPVANAGPDQFICGSGTVQLGTATTAGYTYSWTPATGLSSSTISDPILTVSNSGSTPDTLIFTVTTTLNGCITADVVQVINSPAPTAIAGPDTVLCSGNSVVIGSGSLANYVYTWTPSTGLSSSTISDPTVTLTNTSGVNDTLYYVLNTALFGCFDNDTIMIVVKPNPVANAGSDATICSGDTVTLGTATTAGYTYSWTPPTNLNSTTISDPFAVITNIGTAQTSITYIVVTTLNGCTTTDSVTITINPQPSVTASANPNSICAGGSATLTASGATGYSWALSTSPATSISTDSVFVVNPVATTTYILTGTNSSSCSNSDTITITVNQLPVVQISAPTFTICNGDTLTLTGTGASNYTWSVLGGATIGPGTSIQVFPSSNTSYVVVGTDGNSCSNSDTVSVTVNPAATLTNMFGNVSVCPGVTGVQYYINNPNPNSSYTWTVTNGTITSGQGTDTIYVDWSVNSGIGIVSVIESTNQGCLSNPVILQVTINVFLTPVAPSGPTTFCANDAHGAIYTTLSTPGSLYMWNTQGGTIVSGDSTSTVTVDWNVTGPQTVLLWYQEISYTSVDTCYGISDTLSVTINPTPITGPISGPTDICVSQDGSFSVANTPSSTYNWTASDGNIVSGNSTNTITANWAADGNSTVTVIETNTFGCKDTVNLPVIINPQPEASFTLDDSNLDSLTCHGFIGTLVNTSAGALTYLWLLPDGTTSTLDNPQVQLSLTGQNIITLIATNNSCSDTAVNTFESTAVGKLFEKIPNIFTPNDDGTNDCFDLGPKIDLRECSEWIVFNRWGEKVFTASSSQPCWNGKKNNNGSKMPAGTYYLLLKISDEAFKGTVTLIR